MKEPVKSKILCFNNYRHGFFFFLQMENYFLICGETHMLTVPGKTSFISLNLLLITWDGSVLLAVWLGFPQMNFFFRKVIGEMLRLHNEAAVSLWQAGLGGAGKGPWYPKHDEGLALGARRSLGPTHSHDLPLPAWEKPSQGKQYLWILEKEHDQNWGALYLIFAGVILLPLCRCVSVTFIWVLAHLSEFIQQKWAQPVSSLGGGCWN